MTTDLDKSMKAIQLVDDGIAAYEIGDYSKALNIFRPLANYGDHIAQNYLGDMYESGIGVAEDSVEAVKWYRLAVDQGHSHAQVSLGVMYASGKGVLTDYDEMYKLFHLAAEQCNEMAQFNLGYIYDDGIGVVQDTAKAFKWYRLAAEQGNAGAQHALGMLYANSDGGAENDTEMVKWHLLAAEQGVPEAQYCLGLMYDTGIGVTQNYAEAINWYQLAAEQGMAEAQYNLGCMYASGKGVPKSSELVLKWFRLAAEQGHDEAQQQLLSPHLETEADIQLEIQTIAEFTSAELNFKKNFSIQSIVNSTDDGFASKIEQITSMATEEVCSDVGLILHNRYMVKFLGGGNYSHTVFEPHEMPIARQISAEINEQFQCHTVVMLKRLGKEPFMDLSQEINAIADEIDDIVEADVRQGPDHGWTPTTIGRFYLSKLTTHITKLP